MKYLVAAALCAVAIAAQAQTVVHENAKVIYDNFDEGHKQHLYDCWNYVQIHSRSGKSGTLASVAVPFTPLVDAAVTRFEYPLLYTDDSPDGGVDIWLAKDKNDFPGKRLSQKAWQQDLKNLGECWGYFQFLYQPGHEFHVKAGRTYWVMIKARPNVDAGWYLNSMGFLGQYAVRLDTERTGWTLVDGPLPALRVYALP